MAEKKTIFAKEVIADIRVGMTDDQPMMEGRFSGKGILNPKSQLKAPWHLTIWLVALTVVVPSLALADALTFDEMYSKEVGLWIWGVAILFAVGAAAFLWFTGFTGSPLVVGIGTWIGNMAGFTGIAATNYGLALLGGGAVAAGGFGVAGGTVVLTALVAFSSSLATDYVFETAFMKYEESRFLEASKKMPVLPFPLSTKGNEHYREVLGFLEENFKKDELPSGPRNAWVVSAAIVKLEKRQRNKVLDNRGLLLLAILYHYRSEKGDLAKAVKIADRVIAKEKSRNVKEPMLTVPLAIRGVCSLGIEHVNAESAVADLAKVVQFERKEAMLPIVGAVFADRFVVRNDIFEARSMTDLMEAGLAHIEDRAPRDTFILALVTRYNYKMNEYWSAIKYFHANLQNDAVVSDAENMKTLSLVFQKHEGMLKNIPLAEGYLGNIDPRKHYWIERLHRDEIQKVDDAVRSIKDSLRTHAATKRDAETLFKEYQQRFRSLNRYRGLGRFIYRGWELLKSLTNWIINLIKSLFH